MTVASLVSGLAALFAASIYPHHRAATECAVHKGMSYCNYEGSPESDTLIYFLHGFGNDETAWGWNPVVAEVESHWQSDSSVRPHVVSISLGGFWLYAGAEQGERLQEFAEWFQTRFQTPKRRFLYGDSMGGHNALRWALDYPAAFSRVALICPALPASLIDGRSDFSGRWPLNRLADILIGAVYAADSSKNPLTSLGKRSALAPADLYIGASSQDEFGFFEGDQQLYHFAHKFPHTRVLYDEQKVPHCNLRPKKLAKFLAGQ